MLYVPRITLTSFGIIGMRDLNAGTLPYHLEWMDTKPETTISPERKPLVVFLIYRVGRFRGELFFV